MWFTGEFSIPEPVLQAQRANQLVLFVGAGASMGAPSLLPNFAQLAIDVARDVGAEVTDEVQKAAWAAPDKFLTELEERDYPVHERIQQRVRLSAEPNGVHRALVRLFPQASDIRIVTTNYDQHLTVAVRETFGGVEPTLYRAPALPVGRDFTGIVHLHGCLDQRPQDLVATFGDFGRAYLTDAWATRFLQEMFRTFTVLFVGYSNDDQIMQYLARGLPPDSRRFGLIGDKAPAQWKALGITAVTYPTADRHAALEAGLERWAEVSGWGRLQHERKIRDLVTAPDTQDESGTPSVPTDPGDLSYLESTLQDGTVDLFTRYAQDPVWLAWANTRPAFTPLFWPGLALDGVGRALAWWLADTFAAKHPAVAWSLVRERGGVLHPEVAQNVAQVLRRDLPTSQVVAGWVPVLLQARASGSVLTWLLSSLSWPEHQGSILLLLDHLLVPQPKLGFSTAADAARFDMDALTGDAHVLRAAWDGLSPHLDEFASRLLPGLERHLRAAHLAASAGREQSAFDVLSLQRSAIEPHRQDAHHSGFDVLIDIARDCSQHLAATAPERTAPLFESWIGSGVPFLCRLAVHGWNARLDLSADDKLRWVLEHDLLYATAPRHEVFRLIADALPSASAVRSELLEQVLAGPYAENGDAQHDERRAYAIYSLLCWVTDHEASFAEAAGARAQLQAAHPNFAPSRYPDLFIVTEATTPQSPFSAVQLGQMTSDEDIDALDDYQPVPGPGTFADRFTLLTTVVEATAINPSWGVTVARRLITGRRWESQLWPRLLDGWTRSGAGLSENQALEVLGVVMLLDRESTSAGAAEMVRLLLSLTTGSTATAVQDAAGAVATALVEVSRRQAPGEAEPGLYGDWVADLTDFWLQDAYQRWSATEEVHRAGLPEPSRGALGALVDSAHPQHLTAIATLARNLPMLIAMDEAWTTEFLLPAFSWDDDTALSLAAWGGYLLHPQWNERVLELLRSDLLKTFTRITDGALREALTIHTADLCLYSASAAKPESGIVTAFFGSSDAEARRKWAQHIGWRLAKLQSADAESNWERWIKDYWRGRLKALPRSLGKDETGEMLSWVLPSGALFPEAVELLVESPSLFKGAFFFRGLKDSPVLTAHPAAASRLVAHVLTHLDGPVVVCDDIGAVIETLIAVQDPALTADLRRACDGAAEAGCTGALDWADKLPD